MSHAQVLVPAVLLLRMLCFGIAAMTLHELGHLLAAKALGVRVKSVGLCWRGMYTVREPGEPTKNLMVTLAGPAFNLLLLAACLPFLHVASIGDFAIANLCMGVVNLLPIRGADGDRAWDLAVTLRKARARAARVGDRAFSR